MTTPYAFFGESIFIARLRGRQNEKIFSMFVTNLTLVSVIAVINDIHKVINNAAFTPHDEVEIT